MSGLFSRRVPFILFVVLILLGSGGCAKKAVSPMLPMTEIEEAPSFSAPPGPTVSLSASPARIQQGESSVLTWHSSDAVELMIDGGVGPVAPSGSQTIWPNTTTTYRVTARGPGGVGEDRAHVTVVAPTPSAPPELSADEFFASKIRDVFFDFDRHDLGVDALRILDANARALAERPGLFFIIEGHCDERGTQPYNLALGDRRANAARSYLISLGIAPQRIQAVSYGEERPFDPGHNEVAWSQNRRAHFVLASHRN